MQYTLLYKRKLPHFQPRGGTFFITLRLAFDIPEKYLQALNRYRESLRKNHAKPEDVALSKEIIKKKVFAFEDDLFDKCGDGVTLTNDPAAGIIQNKLLEMNGDLLYLYAFTIMPNHVHMLIRPLLREGVQVSMSQVIKQFKGSTARLINLSLQCEGQLWFREYHDHWVRSQQELINVIEYIRNNPVRAGLVKEARQWHWTWLNPELWQEE